MRFRACCALLFLFPAAMMAPELQAQAAIPWAPLVAPKPWVAPLVAPKPVVAPAPIGLTPPVPITVAPRPPPQKDLEAKPAPERPGTNRGPPAPPTSTPRPECVPQKRPHLGGDALHNRCADKVPQNAFRGFDALVNGKHFDALDLSRRVLWELKTDNFDAYSAFLQGQAIATQVSELQRERDLARACGFGFWVGVRSAAHKVALLEEIPELNITVMDWC